MGSPAPQSRSSAIASEIRTSIGVFAQVFAVADLRRLLGAYVGFTIAEMANFFSILIYAYNAGGAAAVGLVTFLQLIPAALFAPFGSTFGDRYRREKVLPVAYGLFALSTAAIAAAIIADLPVSMVYLLAAVNATVLTLVRPVQESLLPALAASSEQVMGGYVASGTVENVSIVIGPLLAGFVSAAWGTEMVFWITTGLLLFGTALVLRIETRTRLRPPEETKLFAEATKAFGLLWRDPKPRTLVTLLTAAGLLYGLLDVLTVVLAYEVLSSDESGVALLNSAIGVGCLVGSVLTVLLIGRTRLAPWMRRGLLLSGLPLLLAAFLPEQGWALVALATLGIGLTLVDVTGKMMLQRVTPDATLSRVFGVLEGAALASEGVGSILAAVAIATLGVTSTVVIAAIFLPILALIAHVAVVRADIGIRVRLEHIHLLKSLPIFAALGPADLEGLATKLETVDAPEGLTLVAEGDVGDHFFVIEDGNADVVHAGKSLATLGPGDFFGEIALLRDVPRTVTVNAASDCRLLVLERDDFLGAVSLYPCQLETAESFTQHRLDEQG